MQQPALSTHEFVQFQKLLYRVSGIKLSDAKKEMVCGRLGKRLRDRGLQSYGDYLHLLSGPGSKDELQVAIDLLTTNETYFFREPTHFTFLREEVLSRARPGHPFRVWSAACSSGEEVYSLAMVLSEGLGDSPWEVIGSDLSTRVLERARAGQYPMERIKDIPKPYLTRYCLKGVRSQAGTFLIDNKLRQRTRFLQVNLNEDLPDLGLMDVIFLRNILIYFDGDTKQRVVARLVQRLARGGYFIVGHSETLTGMQGDLLLCAPTIYQKPAGQGAGKTAGKTAR